MTMNELKPIATAFFNTLITNASAQEQFADAFDLWDGEPSLYDGTTNAYKAVIRRYAQPINEELERIALVENHPWTRQSTVTGNENGQDTDDDTHTRENNSVDTSENSIGQRENMQYVYPQGYVSQPDTAYLATSATNAASSDSTNAVGKSNEEYTGNRTHKHVADTTHITEETDVLQKAQLLSKNSTLSDLIESCVFALLGGRVEYKETKKRPFFICLDWVSMGE